MKAVAAMALNRVIGNKGQIPWHLPEDFRWFKSLTMGGTLVMGSRTLLSLGRPLTGRGHVVLSRNPEQLLSQGGGWAVFWEAARSAGWRVRMENEWQGGADVGDREIWLFRGKDKIADLAKSERPVFLAGGAQVYGELLWECDELYLSVVERDVEGDAVFPEFESRFEWVETPLRADQFHVRRYVQRSMLG